MDHGAQVVQLGLLDRDVVFAVRICSAGGSVVGARMKAEGERPSAVEQAYRWDASARYPAY